MKFTRESVNMLFYNHNLLTMNFNEQLKQAQQTNHSLVCVGLDPDLSKLPSVCLAKQQPILDFNKAIIDACADLVCAFKPQIAYYAAEAAEEQLEASIFHIKDNYPQIPVILDAKRGDIGATAKQYAREAFERYQADALTVNPYMGFDTIEPYLEYSDKGVIILCHTSNPGAALLQEKAVSGEGYLLFEYVAKEAKKLYDQGAQVSLVVGATVPNELKMVRDIVGDMPLLVPGLGAQGGDMQATLESGLGKETPALILNNSRAIIFAGHNEYYAHASRQACDLMRNQINAICEKLTE
jgi:orotidine-5'-phosphate decarboxylase